jgi:hypothetical protein
VSDGLVVARANDLIARDAHNGAIVHRVETIERSRPRPCTQALSESSPRMRPSSRNDDTEGAGNASKTRTLIAQRLMCVRVSMILNEVDPRKART